MAPKSEQFEEKPDAPQPFGWRVEGKVVRVRDVAQFPMIDPFNGRSDEVMELRRIGVRVEPECPLSISRGGNVDFLR